MIAMCARLVSGEIAIFDKAYVHFQHLFSLISQGVFWDTRAKDNMFYHVCKRCNVNGPIIRNAEITLKV
jgi:hypothetical protein